ncbi:hypothetical protein GGD50_001613 [Rhizobium paranaense]|uniref:Uncharacterized protein n=1 Tax=Rhizobium paranaense TaxID=1650438 RepID=A0A7W8XPJ0_9HYPH|nr:hypothetical protein [Rhizobium paranaense]
MRSTAQRKAAGRMIARRPTVVLWQLWQKKRHALFLQLF